MSLRLLAVIFLLLASSQGFAQGFELASLQDTYAGVIGETIKAPIRFRNTSEKTLTLIVRKVLGQIGSTQKNYYCLDNNCLDQKADDYIVRIDPGQMLNNFYVVLEAGLVSGESALKYVVYNRSNPTQSLEFELNFNVTEKPEKENIYSSRFVTLRDVYPNPVIDQAVIEYKILNDRIKAKILVHNLLGNVVSEYALPIYENLVRLKTDDLSPGIYFYTLYVDNESVITRKLIVRK
ncbi:MAG: T9SS type A sorting domain-containing protein [Chryseolinea sp.]